MTGNPTVAAILAKAPQSDGEGDDGYDAEAHLHQSMEDFARAVHDTPPNLRGMMAAFRSAFECLESMEDEEESD